MPLLLKSEAWRTRSAAIGEGAALVVEAQAELDVSGQI